MYEGKTQEEIFAWIDANYPNDNSWQNFKTEISKYDDYLDAIEALDIAAKNNATLETYSVTISSVN